MAKVLWNAAVETVSGALTKVDRKSQHVYDQRMILATHRTASSMNRKCARLYLRTFNNIAWQQTPGQDAMAARNVFSKRATAIRLRSKDLNALSKDQANFFDVKPLYKQKFGQDLSYRFFLWLAVEKYGDEDGNNINWPANGIALEEADLHAPSTVE